MKHRYQAKMPFQDWRPFPDESIVQVFNVFGESSIGPASKFWWGYERECGEVGEGVIVKARRLDKPLSQPKHIEE